jgi:hypothetical protein
MYLDMSQQELLLLLEEQRVSLVVVLLPLLILIMVFQRPSSYPQTKTEVVTPPIMTLPNTQQK